MRKYLTGFICLILTCSAQAERKPEDGLKEPNPIDLKYEACLQKADSYPAMLSCVEFAHREWNMELDANYENLEAKLTAKGGKALEATQKAWLVHRDAEFAFYPEIQAVREVDAFMFAEKKMRLVSNRAKVLQDFSEYIFLAEPEKKP